MIFKNLFERKPKPIMPEQELKKAIIEIEDIESLTKQEKFMLLLVLCGLKPRTEIGCVFFNDNGDALESWMWDVQLGLKTMMPYVNFYFHDFLEKDNYLFAMIEISPKGAKEKIFDLSSDKDHKKIGTELGYPKTAVDAFVKDQTYKSSEKYILGLTDEQKKFTYFAYSKKHYKKEIKFLQKMIDEVKRRSPKIYQQVMESE